MKTYQDRAVLVTGASSGIGAALTRRFAAEGARLAIAARRVPALEEVASPLREQGAQVEVIEADLGVEDSARAMVRSAVQRLGPLDVLVNNAGYGLTAQAESMPLDRARQLFEVNVWGLLAASQEALTGMLERGSGLIVNVGSVLGERSLPTMSAYCMSKFSVAALSDSMRTELRDRGVHVLLAEPGLTRTGFGEAREIVGQHRRFFDDSRAMSADEVARRILRAGRRRRDRIAMTAGGRALVWANRLCPGLVNRMLELGYRQGRFG